MFTYDRLHQLALTDNPQIAKSLVQPLEARIASSSINTLLRRAHFMAQVCYESNFFCRLIENLSYSADRITAIWPRLAPYAAQLAHNSEGLGNAAYAGYVDVDGKLHDQLGNGLEGNGNGYRYRGRGLLQITGRYNYAKYGANLGLMLLENPDIAASPDNAVRLAISFWDGANCNEAADRDSVVDVTAKINAELEGLSERTFLTTRAKNVFT